ncbi:transmembrane 4 L6 family member 5-like [Petaurus breviceps papuanus]|uniref:transmembrane 4 L6 family member 5-like n=1 Tax=Petaurus breviceps papuanus TaxID=3040969 RepID=UPI0036D922B0
MLRSIICSAAGALGALYSLSVSGAALENGPLCLTELPDTWTYPFENSNGNYLSNSTLWDQCLEPPKVVAWNVTLFALLVAVSALELVLCGIQLVNGVIGVFCGDCRKKDNA